MVYREAKPRIVRIVAIGSTSAPMVQLAYSIRQLLRSDGFWQHQPEPPAPKTNSYLQLSQRPVIDMSEAHSHSPAKRKRGRPTSVYSPDVASEICRRVSNGETLREVCRTPGMPPESTVRWWYLTDTDGFAARYMRARESQAEAWADQIVEISQERHTEPNDRRVRVDTKKWLMSKLHPRRYGDKVTVSGDPDAPIRHMVATVELEKLSAAELDALERFCEARLAATVVVDDEHRERSDEQS
jgi:hypothetical protein